VESPPTERRLIAYLDASALVKLGLDERESPALRIAMRDWPRCVSSRFALVEVIRAVRAAHPARERLVRVVLGQIALLRLDNRLLMDAAYLEPVRGLRALDALHLASALSLGPVLGAFISYDRRQLAVARAYGLPALSPA
jgi:predicted nucleic acid-binding protein